MAYNAQGDRGEHWSDGVDTGLMRRLLGRAIRPGVINLSEMERRMARHDGMTRGIPLAERLNRFWIDIQDATSDGAPIVYAEPRPYGLGGKDLGSAATQAFSGPRGSVGQPSKSVGQSVEKRGAASTRGTTSTGSIKPAPGSTMVIQRKALPGASPSSLPAAASKSGSHSVTGSSGAVEPMARGSAAVPTTLASPAKGFDDPLPVVSLQEVGGQGQLLSRASEATELPFIAAVTEYPSQSVAESRLNEGASASVLIGKRFDPDATLPRVCATVVPATPETSGLTLWLVEWRDRGRRTVLPTVREQGMAAAARGRIKQHQPLPFATAPLPLVERPAQASGRGLTAAARNEAVRHYMDRVTKPRVGSDDMAIPAETTSPPPPQVDIDGIVDKVERRFVRRLAIESERRGRTR